MTGDTDGASVRLAELVAALSLGVDLGFGQPMEHVLRQCLIAMRLAERVGLDDEGRADVYYTALLVNVGCHADAHEQAKWFGDDIALKSGKYDHELGERARRRGDVPAARLGQPAAAPVPGRAGVHARGAPRRRRDGRASTRGSLACSASNSTCRRRARRPCRRLRAMERQGLARRAEGRRGSAGGEGRPAGGVHRGRAPRRRGRRGEGACASDAPGRQFDPALAELLCSDAELIFADLDGVGTWNAVIDAEPGLALDLSGDAVRRGAPGDRRTSST